MEDSHIMQPGVSIKASVTIGDVKKIVFELYGIQTSQLVELNGYDDWNYHIIAENSENSVQNGNGVGKNGFTLKIINSLDSKKPGVFEAQSLLLLHLGKTGFRCPMPILTKNGKFFETVKLRSGEHIVRLLEYIDGTIFHKITRTPSLLYQVGEIACRMNVAMKSFHHPSYDNHKSLWMLESVPEIAQFLFAIPDGKKKQLVRDVIQEFRDRVLSISNTLERGLIHGDFNEQNIIVQEKNGEYELKAVIDFGDAQVACYLFELAITMCYMMLVDNDLRAGGFVLAGYSAVRKVPDIEKSLLRVGKTGFRCPMPILTKNGKFFETVKLRSGEHIVRLLEYIDGTIFHKITRTPSLLYQVGEIACRMNVAMKSFHHPSYDNHKSLWMLESVPEIAQFLFAIPDGKKKQLVRDVIQEFRDRVLSISNTLERGLIHGDFNEQNIIVQEKNGEYELKAVIDFGDAQVACYLFELAITMCYMMLVDNDLRAGGFVLAGYSAVRKVPDIEKSLLRVCIAARLCQSLVIGAYSSLQDPENSYVLTTAAQGWVLLNQIWNETDSGLLEKWTNIS